MDPITCPSATCSPGASLLGAVGEDGRIKHLRTPLRVDEDFVARAGPAPEARMRFAAPCHEGECGHWTGSACGLIDKVLDHLEQAAPEAKAATVPPCTIRASCRWYSQTGQEACLACDLVVRQPA